jgi:hypothetical protein
MPLLGRGTSSIETTVLFGLALAAVPLPVAAPAWELPLAVSDMVPAELPWVVLPALPDWSPLLPEVPDVPDVPELPEVPELPDVPELPEPVPPPQPAEPLVLVPAPVPDMPPASLPVAPVVELPVVAPGEPLLPLAPLPEVSPPPESPPPRMPAQPDRPSAMASKPARTTLWCCCFMIDPPLILSVGMRDDVVCHCGKRPDRARRSS